MKNSRRQFLKAGSLILGAATASAAGKICLTEQPTPEQGLGPFFPRPGTPQIPVRENPDGDLPIYLANDSDLTFVINKAQKAKGQIVDIKGTLLDEKCNALQGATIIIWQASSKGRYNHLSDGQNHDFISPKDNQVVKRELDPNFQYWGKTVTDWNGDYSFRTIVPGFYPADLTTKWYRPPHIHFMVSAMGYPQFVTQMYFKGEILENNEWIQELNARDLLLEGITDEKEKQKLVVEFKKVINEDHPQGEFNISLKRS